MRNSFSASGSAISRSRQRSLALNAVLLARVPVSQRSIWARIGSVHVAHQLADELHVPAPRFVLAYAFQLVERVAQGFGQIELIEVITA